MLRGLCATLPGREFDVTRLRTIVENDWPLAMFALCRQALQ
jgi:hypothetical protein